MDLPVQAPELTIREHELKRSVLGTHCRYMQSLVGMAETCYFGAWMDAAQQNVFKSNSNPWTTYSAVVAWPAQGSQTVLEHPGITTGEHILVDF